MRLGKLLVIILFVAVLAMPSIICSEEMCEKASKIITITNTPQIEPGEEGKLEFNVTNPYPLVMENVSMTAEIYYYVEYTWFTEQESCEIEKVGNPPKFGNSTATNITIYWEKIPSDFTETKSLSIHSSKKTDQGTYFIRFQLEFDYSDTHYKMKSIGYFSREEWENATSNASGYFGGINISMLGVDGIIPETTFGVKEPIPLWPLYLLIAVTAFLGIVAVRSYMKSGGVKEETKEMKIGIDDELIMELEKELATTEKKMGELEKEKPEGYKEKIEEPQRNLENISFEIDRLKRGA